MNKTIAIYTLGCKVNQGESQAILDAFRHKGWQPVDFDQPAAAYIINTCTVTQAADQKSRKMIRAAKKSNPRALLIVTGCYAESGAGELAAIKEIDLVLGNRRKEELPDLVEELWQEKTLPQEIDPCVCAASAAVAAAAAGSAAASAAAGSAAASAPAASAPAASMALPSAMPHEEALSPLLLKGLDRTRATLKLQDGCRQFCSYCIIPYVRREWQSLPAAKALERVGELAEQGLREVVLLGIHLGAYGWETGKQDQLSVVLEQLLAAYPQVRFRLGSLEPMEATARLIGLIRDYPNACKHLHLPLQSGTDSILKAMNRPYLTADFRAKAAEIRGAIPDIALTTDVMVGFPGETEEDFRQCLAFVEEMAFSRLHVFAYSRRPGTPAADMADQVPKAVKEERSKALITLGQKLQDDYGAGWLGRRQWVLAEEEIGGGFWSGHSDNYLEVVFQLPEALPETASVKGRLLPVKITGKSDRKAEAWQGVYDPV